MLFAGFAGWIRSVAIGGGQDCLVGSVLDCRRGREEVDCLGVCLCLYGALRGRGGGSA